MFVIKKLLFLFSVVLTGYTCFSQENQTKQQRNSFIVNISELLGNKYADETEKSNITVVKTKRETASERFLKKRKSKKAQAIKTDSLVHSVLLPSSSLGKIKLKKVNSLIVKAKVFTEETMTFKQVEQIPQFKTCVNSSNTTNCFNYEMRKHIKENFVYPQKAINRGVQGKVLVSFVIGTKGIVEKIKVSASKEVILLQKEAYRVIELLNQFIPGKHKGSIVNVTYTFPMNLTLNTD